MKDFLIKLNLKQVLRIAMATGLVLRASLAVVAQDLAEMKRGLVAVADENGVYIGWRLLGYDPDSVGYNLYRITDGATSERLNDVPMSGGTNFYDSLADPTSNNQYYVVAVVDGVEQDPSDTVNTWQQNYLNIPLNRPEGGTTPDGVSYTYSPNDASVADLDGDGDYEIVLKWDPSNAKDNAHDGHTGNVFLDAYEMDGTFLWRIDQGINVRAGAHYTQFMVYDLDGDGKAEVACRTAPGTRDASGDYLATGPAATTDHTTDYRNNTGRIIEGPEFLTVFNGETGTEIASVDFEPARGSINDWGDNYGNRGDRFLGAVAYLDGQKPSLVMARGIYEKMELAAWDFSNDELTLRWHFKTQDGYPEWAGMGSHNLSVGDVDQDGRDEIIYGNAAIDDDGTGLWTLRSELGKATSDAMHLADIMPDRAGLEKFGGTEGEGSPGAHLIDARTGEVLWKTAPGDVGRGVSADLVPEFYGMESWGGTDGLRSAGNVRVGNAPASINFVIWWDGDLSRELLDGNAVRKYNLAEERENVIFQATGCVSNNGTKSTPSLQADIFGDWREEVIFRTEDNNNLRIFTTVIPTEYRIKTLMQDRQYRLAIAWQNNSYNQPPHPGFYLGNDMFTPTEEIPPSSPTGLNINLNEESIRLDWGNNSESDLAGYLVYRSEEVEDDFQKLTDTLLIESAYTDTAFVLDVAYFYKITAVDTFGNESAPSEVLSAIVTNKPNAPDNIQGRNGRSRALVFWDDSPSEGILGYNIYVSETSGTGYEKLNTELLGVNEYEHSGINNDETYYYVVTSVDSEELESYFSDEVAIVPGRDVILQAEDARSEGVLIESNHIGFNGDGFANFDLSGYLEFDRVYNHTGGWYNLVMRYALGSGSRTGTLTVNDSTFAYTMEATAAWTDFIYDTVKVKTTIGFTNTIRFEATGSDFGNLDEIILNDQTTPPQIGDENPLGVHHLSSGVKVFPNPFTSSVEIEVNYAGNASPYLQISNLLGQVIMNVELEEIKAGRYYYRWDGTTTSYQSVPAGVYFLTIHTDKTSLSTVRLILSQ